MIFVNSIMVSLVVNLRLKIFRYVHMLVFYTYIIMANW